MPSRSVAFAALCTFSGSGWLLEQLYPSRLGFPLAACVHFLIIGSIALAVWIGPGVCRLPLRPAGSIALAGAIIFTVPGAAAHLTAGIVSGATRTALFSSIPLFTLLLLSIFRRNVVSPSQPILASVIGIGGVVLLLSADLPGTLRGWVGFSVLSGCCALIAGAGIWIHKWLQNIPIAPAAALISFGSAVMLGTGVTKLAELNLRNLSFECARCLAFDLPVVWLTTWLLREVNPAKLSARYLLVPFVTALEGFAAMHAAPEVRSLLALAGMVGSGLTVFLHDGNEEAVTLHLQ